jgi:hypothetical protein
MNEHYHTVFPNFVTENPQRDWPFRLKISVGFGSQWQCASGCTSLFCVKFGKMTIKERKSIAIRFGLAVFSWPLMERRKSEYYIRTGLSPVPIAISLRF